MLPTLWCKKKVQVQESASENPSSTILNRLKCFVAQMKGKNDPPLFNMLMCCIANYVKMIIKISNNIWKLNKLIL